MVASIKFLSVLFFLSLLSKGNCECTLNDISISQTATGSQVSGKQQWKATITNNCVCSQSSLKLDCNGFNTVETVDKNILTVAGAVCLVNGGQPISESTPISFTYSWDNAFDFKPLFSKINCS